MFAKAWLTMFLFWLFKGHYFTIHITPEPNCSYVSFETNAPEKDYGSLIQKVVGLFQPKEFIVTFFANDNSAADGFCKKKLNFNEFHFETYQETRVKNYNVTYAQYTKKPI